MRVRTTLHNGFPLLAKGAQKYKNFGFVRRRLRDAIVTHSFVSLRTDSHRFAKEFH